MLNPTRQERTVLLFILAVVFAGICISYLSKSNSAFKKFLASNSDLSSKNAITDINKADLKALTRLPGIGLGLAGRILEYREARGDFKTIEDLRNVKGIGGQKYESLKDYISVE